MSASPELDAVDRLLLAELQKNGRQPVKGLAARAGIAASTCAERIRGLAGRGLITGFRAEVGLEALGRGEQALVGVRVRPHSRKIADDFVTDMLACEEVLAVFNVSGQDDFLVHVAVPGTKTLHDFVIDRLADRKEVGNVTTNVVFGHHRREVLLPLDGGAA